MQAIEPEDAAIKLLLFPRQQIPDFPFNLKLERCAGDLGNCGIYNQYEVARQLLTVSLGRSQDWHVQQLDWEQYSCRGHTVVGIKHDLGTAGKAKTNAAAATPHPGDEGDLGIFDHPSLQPGKRREGIFPDVPSSSSEDSFFSNFPEGYESDVLFPSEPEGAGDEPDEDDLPLPPLPPPEDAPPDAPPEAETSTTASARAANTGATNFDLVQYCLQDKCLGFELQSECNLM